jgi:CRP-like cAMP-binding protein
VGTSPVRTALTKQIATAKSKSDFSAHAFLSTVGKGREMVSFEKKETIFAQGDARDGLFFVQTGKVQLSVVSESGREATLGMEKAISLEKVVLPVSPYACRLPPH